MRVRVEIPFTTWALWSPRTRHKPPAAAPISQSILLAPSPVQTPGKIPGTQHFTATHIPRFSPRLLWGTAAEESIGSFGNFQATGHMQHFLLGSIYSSRGFCDQECPGDVKYEKRRGLWVWLWAPLLPPTPPQHSQMTCQGNGDVPRSETNPRVLLKNVSRKHLRIKAQLFLCALGTRGRSAALL